MNTAAVSDPAHWQAFHHRPAPRPSNRGGHRWTAPIHGTSSPLVWLRAKNGYADYYLTQLREA
jgi:hypothetical protein